jgi:glycosyltransferase involved in cell wall biosynthesis
VADADPNSGPNSGPNSYPSSGPSTGSSSVSDLGSSRPLRIGIVSDCYVPRLGGIEMQSHAGHEVVVITPTPGPTTVDGVRVQRIDVPLLPFDIPFTRKAFRAVGAMLRSERVDVAHFQGGIASPMTYIAARAAQRAGVPSVITLHCVWGYAAPGFALLDRVVDWGKWPVVFSAVSDVAAEPIRRIVGPDRPVVVLPNGISNEAWRIEPVPHDPTVVTLVSVMRLAPRKRPMHLLRMVRRVVDQLPPELRLRVVVIGDGPELPQLEKYLRANGLTEVVELVGRRSRDEIRLIFATADVFVAPANLESFGIAALEGRCAGLPVVAKAQTGIREFITHEREGLLATSDDDMVVQLTRIVRDAELRTRMATFNRSTPSPVDWADVVAKNVEAYRLAMTLV